VGYKRAVPRSVTFMHLPPLPLVSVEWKVELLYMQKKEKVLSLSAENEPRYTVKCKVIPGHY
jgi:hypothetical protein